MVFAAHINGAPCVESTAKVKVQKGSFKFSDLCLGELVADEATQRDGSLLWQARKPGPFQIDDELVVIDARWFGKLLTSGHEVNVDRPAVDANSAPKADCTTGSYAADPDTHSWCCKSHEVAEAEWADELAARRARGELNPQVWPPIIDEDQFDVVAVDAPTDRDGDLVATTDPAFTMDDLD